MLNAALREECVPEHTATIAHTLRGYLHTRMTRGGRRRPTVRRSAMMHSLLVAATAFKFAASALSPPPTDFYERAKLRVDLKAALVRLGATSGCGQFLSPSATSRACEYAARLEAVGLPALPSDLEGTWDLVLTDVEPFRASPFWWALGSALDAFKPGAAARIFPAHRLATAVGEVGRVRQRIEMLPNAGANSPATGKLTSEVFIKAGMLPGLPLALRGDVVSKAEVQLVSDEAGAVGALAAKLLDTRVRHSTLEYGYVAPGGDTSSGELSLSPVFDERALPVGDLLRSVRGGGDADVAARPLLRTTYLDADLRVSRTADEHFFVFVRADDDRDGLA